MQDHPDSQYYYVFEIKHRQTLKILLDFFEKLLPIYNIMLMLNKVCFKLLTVQAVERIYLFAFMKTL